MPILTLKHLDPNSYAYLDYTSMSAGKSFFKEGRITIASFDGKTAVCQAHDSRAIYTVVLKAETASRLSMACDCPQGSRPWGCKHKAAAIQAVHDYIKENVVNQWWYRLDQALDNSTMRKTTRNVKAKNAIVFGLLKDSYYYSGPVFRLHVYRIRGQDWYRLEKLKDLTTQAEKNKFLESDRSWAHFAQEVTNPLDYRSVVNLPLEGIQLSNLKLKASSNNYYYGMDDFASFLPVIAKLDLPIFLMNNRNTFKQRLYPSLDPVQMEVALAHEGEDYSLQAGLSFQGDTFSTIKGSLEILSDNPAWVLAGRYLAPVDNPEVLSLLHFFPVTIPGKEVEEFRQNYFPVIVKRVPIRGDVISWTDVEAEPVPRLYLRDQEGVLSAELRFGYGDYEVTADPKAGPETVLDVPGSWGMVRIHRRLETEARHYQQLGQKQFGLKRAPYGSTTGTFELRARTHPLDFLLHSIPSLTKAGYEVYGQDDLKTARINRNKPLISLNISSGIDWFDVQAVVRYGDQEVPLRDLRRALGKRERFIKLADGSIGQIPEEWIDKYKKLFDLAEDTGDSLRVRDYQLPLVDTLLEEADQRQIAAEFQERRERLRRFERVHPQPIPQGFAGELRPYQKAGFDWLHFLHEYGFGGCLADDMGLGKTIQALAFLQSLKELGKNQGPALLVVPKSLIGNWLREAERFTPDLRFLAYIGNNRPKDTSIFTEYDVILTTYQTMLRDIELLRKYPFYYVILDESQNIKNPLSQSSKAVRLINAKHHLVMTGTPVENNTFELWSQFAFLNPGLLGSLDYFKREFASPIENRTNSSEVTIQLLRKLIFPFILRRTKEQVAPELPERTERLLYTDLEPAQRRLYNQTRDYYRGVLLGMIDKEGINDVRMKILEGLLRLRQICIHPALIQQNFHGDSTKFELLLETLDTLQSEGHKALIFSQFVETLHLLQAELDARGIRYTYLDGQTVDRQAQIDTFQSDLTIPFFLISLKAGGVGLNLTAADYVIHIDPWWNPAVEMQAADRAHRIGQDKPVFIYKIIVRNSVEEKILQLQERKKELVDQLISTDASIFKSMTKEDVQALFS